MEGHHESRLHNKLVDMRIQVEQSEYLGKKIEKCLFEFALDIWTTVNHVERERK